MVRFLFLSLALLLLPYFASSYANYDLSGVPTPVVSSPAGPIQGITRQNANNYLGIPYAVPPTGVLRYTAPTPYPAFTSTFNASSWGPGCMQKCLLPAFACPQSLSEDCLTLNIYTPTNVSPNANLSVLAFFHGGNFRSGLGGCPLYDASLWVNRENFIVVTANYRLGAFGFFFNSGIPANLALMDQQMVLKWIQNNIAAFGGNPQQVTIAGQSAGGTSIDAHLQNPESLALISGAIVESVPGGIPLRSWPEFTHMLNSFSKIVGCSLNDTECFQSVTAEELLTAQLKSASNPLNSDRPIFEFFQAWEPLHSNVPFPQPDGASFPLPNLGMKFFSNLPTNLPVMYGTVSEEGFVFIYEIFQKKNLTKLEADILVASIWGVSNAIELLKLYPAYPNEGKDRRPATSRLVTEYVFTCPARNITRNIAEMRSNEPDSRSVYRYFFSQLAAEGEAGWGPKFPICWNHVCHGAELAFVFNSAWAIGQSLKPEEQMLANTMGTYWANFAKTGNPNMPTSVPEWDPVSPTGTKVMSLNDQDIGMIQDPRSSLCDVWDTIGYEY